LTIKWVSKVRASKRAWKSSVWRGEAVNSAHKLGKIYTPPAMEPGDIRQPLHGSAIRRVIDQKINKEIRFN
jgi:hypothetical protein